LGLKQSSRRIGRPIGGGLDRAGRRSTTGQVMGIGRPTKTTEANRAPTFAAFVSEAR